MPERFQFIHQLADLNADEDGNLQQARETPYELDEWDSALTTMVQAVVRQDMPYGQAAGIVGYKKDWVGEWVHEWQDGDHTEFVGFGPGDVNGAGDMPAAADD